MGNRICPHFDQGRRQVVTIPPSGCNSFSFRDNEFSQCHNTIYRYPGLESGLCMVRVLCTSVATFELCTTKKANLETNRGKRTGRTTVSLRSVKNSFLLRISVY